MVELEIASERFALAQTFTISRGSRDVADVLSVTLRSAQHQGWGECVPYRRYGESMVSVRDQIESVGAALRAGLTRDSLQTMLPAGAARNAVDCALWDLEAKQRGIPVWKLAGLTEPGPVLSAYSLSLDSPAAMRESAALHSDKPLLKIKLGSDNDIARLQAVRKGAPNSRLIVDANEGWQAQDYDALAPVMLDLGVVLVEQPLPADNDALLSGRSRPLPVCADESCHDRQSLSGLNGKYDMINIKLDKTGGLTEALALRTAALEAGYRIMVGCMVSSSLAMAPAVLIAQGAEIVDLDGPLLLAEDRSPPIQFEQTMIHPAPVALWG